MLDESGKFKKPNFSSFDIINRLYDEINGLSAGFNSQQNTFKTKIFNPLKNDNSIDNEQIKIVEEAIKHVKNQFKNNK